MNPALARLNPYPFERLARLLEGAKPPAGLAPIAMSIGEPRHAPPPEVVAALRAAAGELDTYPATRGLAELRAACAGAIARTSLPAGAAIDPATQVLPANGTREALFAFIQAAVDRARGNGAPLVAMPNPGYQVYEGAAILAGASPLYMDANAGNGFLPDLEAVPASDWDRCAVLVLCCPGNPTGSVYDLPRLRRALELAERHDFIIAADECYADLYLDEAAPPPSLLRAALAAGHGGYERCVVFRSLSKRSGVPGLRSGCIAGDAALLRDFHQYRTYHGSAMAIPTQRASIAAWSDESHVVANRALYREKFARVLPLLRQRYDVPAPAGGFYLWPDVGGDDAAYARRLYAEGGVTLLPGSYMARDAGAGNPGAGRVRISLVPGVETCVEAATRMLAMA